MRAVFTGTNRMRSDMARVIVERPRLERNRVRRGRETDDEYTAAVRIGLKRDVRLRGGEKWFSDHLGPLRRFLEAQVGRPWNKVWSEVCADLDRRSTVQQHVRDHVLDFVATRTESCDGDVWVQELGTRKRLRDSRLRLYVDPRTGILRRNRHWRSERGKVRTRNAAAAKDLEGRMRAIATDTQLHLLDDGAWWEVRLAAVPRAMGEVVTWWGMRRRELVELPCADVVLRAGLSRLARDVLYGRPGVFAVAKRQLSRKEMRDRGLRSRSQAGVPTNVQRAT